MAQVAAGAESVSSLYTEWTQLQQAGAKSAIGLMVVGQGIAILANYLSSKMVVADYRDTFPNALRVWVLQWLTTIMVVVGGFVMAAALNAAGSPQLFPIVGIGLGVLWLVLIVRIPMAVYRILALRAVGFMAVALLMSLIGTLGAQFALGPSPVLAVNHFMKVAQLPPPERASYLALLQTEQEFAARAAQPLNGELEARDPSKTLEVRAMALKQMYADLEARRRAIRPGDGKAITIYQHQKARYESLLSQLKTEAAQRQSATARQ